MADVKHVFLLRHAKSSWDDPALEDFNRPLAPRGRRAAKVMGAHLRDQRIRPDVVLCSPARRARETLDLVEPAGEAQLDHELYGATAGQLLERLRQLPERVGAVMLIGHNPAIQELAVGLARRGGQRAGGKFPTAALATLTFDGAWRDLAPRSAELSALTTPRELETS